MNENERLLNNLRILTGGKDVDYILSDITRDEYLQLRDFYSRLLTVHKASGEETDPLKPSIQAFLKLKETRSTLSALGLKFSNIVVFNFNTFPNDRIIPNARYPLRAVRIPWLCENDNIDDKPSVNAIKEIIQYFDSIDDNEKEISSVIREFKLPKMILENVIDRYIDDKISKNVLYKCIKKFIDSRDKVNKEVISCPSIDLTQSICSAYKSGSKGCNDRLCFNLIEDILYDCWEECCTSIERSEDTNLHNDEIYIGFKNNKFKKGIEIEEKIHFINANEFIKTMNDDDEHRRFSININKFIQNIRPTTLCPEKNCHDMIVAQINPEPYFSVAILYGKFAKREDICNLLLVYSLISSFNIEVIVREDLKKNSEVAGMSLATARYMHDIKNIIGNARNRLASLKNSISNDKQMEQVNDIYSKLYQVYVFSHKSYMASLGKDYSKIIKPYISGRPSAGYFIYINEFSAAPDDPYLYELLCSNNVIDDKGNLSLNKFIMMIFKTEDSKTIITVDGDVMISYPIPLFGIWGGCNEILNNAVTHESSHIKITLEKVTIKTKSIKKLTKVEDHFIREKGEIDCVKVTIINDYIGNGERTDKGGDFTNNLFFNFIGVGNDNYISNPLEYSNNTWQVTIILWPDFWHFISSGSASEAVLDERRQAGVTIHNKYKRKDNKWLEG